MIGKLACAWLGSLVLLHASTSPDGGLAKAVAGFHDTCRTWDPKGFESAIGAFQQLATRHPESARCHYWLGTAHFHRMLQLQKQTTDEAKAKDSAEHMQKAIDALEAAVGIDPQHAEAHAILGTLYGMRINSSFLRAIRFGVTVQKHHKQALLHGAKNPRVQYLLGAGLLHTAGNDADRIEALKSLLLAEALFEAEEKQKPAPTDPRWGKDACLAFIGQTFALLHRPAEAEDYFRKTLRARPNHSIARAGLEALQTR